MENLVIEANRQRPAISFDATNGVLEMAGRSLPEQAHDLYNPLLEWLDEYTENPKPITRVRIFLEYINSSSNKYILLLLDKLNLLSESGHQVIIDWECDEDDEDLIETIEECIELLSVEINFRPIAIDDDDEMDFE
ncbi:MAG: DUF1987 domain-containing protein [Cytophagales bacterium]|nr:DUF1987 domain-containing protein [Cytophagales bacterium]